MKDVAKLMDAVYEAYNLALPIKGEKKPNTFEPFFAENRWFTKCNEAFNLVARRMGYRNFDRRKTEDPTDAQLANFMFKAMKDPEGDWRQVSGDLAAHLATAGCLVAAVDENTNAPGHIAVVIPGSVEFSPSFGHAVPKVMNVGKDVFIGKRASFAFQASDKPLYFCLKADFEPPSKSLEAA